MKAVSVIIPMYNAEKWIFTGVLQDVYKQTYQDIELIIINDGSKDNTKKYLEQEIEQKKKLHTKIKHIVVHKENSGIANTRNFGIELATGKYLLFLDQDDRIKQDYIEKYLSEINGKNIDILIGGYQTISEKGKILKRFIFQKDNEWAKYQFTAPWGKIYRTEFIKNNHITFLNHSIGEDTYFNCLAYSKTQNIEIFEYIGYSWVQNLKSFSHTKQKEIKNADKRPVFDAILKDTNITLSEPYYRYYFIREITHGILSTLRKQNYNEALKNWGGV